MTQNNKILTQSEIKKKLKKLADWNYLEKSGSLTLKKTFKDHLDALVFIARVTVHAQILDHHPDILFTYKKVVLTLKTHEAKSLTSLDFTLAERIDELVHKQNRENN